MPKLAGAQKFESLWREARAALRTGRLENWLYGDAIVSDSVVKTVDASGDGATICRGMVFYG